MSTQTVDVNLERPSLQPIWSWGAAFVAIVVFIGICWLQYTFFWNNLQRYYLSIYAEAGVRKQYFEHRPTYYKIIMVAGRGRKTRIALPGEITLYTEPLRYKLSVVAREQGFTRAIQERRVCDNRRLYGVLQKYVYSGHALAHYLKLPGAIAIVVFGALLLLAGPLDRRRKASRLRGRRLRGTEPVSPAGFNRRMHRRKTNGPRLDGVMFLDGAREWLARQLNLATGRGVCVPREREQRHMMMIGDTGSGKSTAIRQILQQVGERLEPAIVYESSGEYVREFYDPNRGDIILNPLDARCPFYSLSDEIEDDAEAATLAASLFPERTYEPKFFPETARDLFAYLLCLRPTPKELVQWLSHPEEIDKRACGTEWEATLTADAQGQRSGVLGTLNSTAKVLRLLPGEDEAGGRFSTKQWAIKRRDWIFITSTPGTRAALRPLISLWVDLLVLRTMQVGAASRQKTWFVLDEVHNLQRLPQLATALTESR